MQNDNPTSAVLSLWQQNLWRNSLNHLTLYQQSYFEIAQLSDITKGVVPTIKTDGPYWIAPIVAHDKNENVYWVPIWIPVLIKDQTLCLSDHALPWVPYIQNEKTFGNAPLQEQMHLVDEWLAFDWLNEDTQLAFEKWQDAYESIQGLYDWQAAVEQLGYELLTHCFVIKEKIVEHHYATQSMLCQRYATLTSLESKELIPAEDCYSHATLLCASPSKQALNQNAFVSAIHTCLLEEGEFIAIKCPIGVNKRDFINAIAHSKIAHAVLTQQTFPAICQSQKGECYAFCYDLKEFDKEKVQAVYLQYHNALELALTLSKAVSAQEQTDEVETITYLQEKDERFEKKLHRLIGLQSELELKSARRFLSWALPNKKLNKEALSYFTQALKLSTQPTQQELVELITEKIRHVKVSRTKIHQELAQVLEQNATIHSAKESWESWLNEHFSTSWQALSFEAQVLMMQNFFAHQIYALVFEKSSWELSQLEACDIMIINEAQQLLPQEALPLLFKAKQALFLGDNLERQAMPVMSTLVEEWELKQHGLIDEELVEELQFKGMLPSFGNAFSVALANSAYQEMLDYGMAVSTLTLNQDEHIEKQYHAISEQGESQIRDNQLINEQQAVFIVHWLETGPLAPQLANTAIITPFVAQKEMLCQKLKEHRLKCEVLTFNELTDKQWQHVVFSPVYCQKNQRPFIFDQGENMLYSLSARARKNIWVIGDLSIFDPRMHSPSGNLAKKLFSAETELIE